MFTSRVNKEECLQVLAEVVVVAKELEVEVAVEVEVEMEVELDVVRVLDVVHKVQMVVVNVVIAVTTPGEAVSEDRQVEVPSQLAWA